MIVRRIKNEELKRVQQIAALAFEFSLESDKDALAFYEKTAASPRSREDTDPRYNIAAFEDDDHTMLCSMWVIPFTVRFDGHEAGMYGIGGVSTLPMYRRRGGIRACFEKALPEMADAGAVFSYLYPFSTAFYRQFGYELGCERQHVRLRLAAIPKWRLEGRAALAEQVDPRKADIQAVYAAWSSRYNMMTLDELDVDYAWLDKLNPFKDREYTYLYYGASGDPKGYMTVKPQNESDRNLLCKRFYFADVEGLKGLLSLLKTFESDHPTASFDLPCDIAWRPLIPEQSMGMCECRLNSAGMARVVNVEKALLMARPRGTGTLRLEISDGQIAQNNGVFEAQFEDGRMLGMRRTDGAPDMRMGINDFSRLILGLYDTDALPHLENVELCCPATEAAKLFYRKPTYITKPF